MDELLAFVALASVVGGLLLVFTGIVMAAVAVAALLFIVFVVPVTVGFVKGVRSALREK